MEEAEVSLTEQLEIDEETGLEVITLLEVIMMVMMMMMMVMMMMMMVVITRKPGWRSSRCLR